MWGGVPLVYVEEYLFISTSFSEKISSTTKGNTLYDKWMGKKHLCKTKAPRLVINVKRGLGHDAKLFSPLKILNL